MFLAGSKQGVNHGCILGGMVGAGKKVIFAAKGNRPDGIFNRVVIYLQMAMQGIGVHPVPQRQRIGNSFADGVYTGQM